MGVAGFGVFKVETVEICRINIELIEAAVSGCFLMNESLVGSSASGTRGGHRMGMCVTRFIGIDFP